jgi:hypothetical protein
MMQKIRDLFVSAAPSVILLKKIRVYESSDNDFAKKKLLFICQKLLTSNLRIIFRDIWSGTLFLTSCEDD